MTSPFLCAASTVPIAAISNRTVVAEWGYRQPFNSNQHRTDALVPWIERYNTGRIH